MPAFASGHIDFNSVKHYWPQCQIFDIASWNSFDSANQSFTSGCLLNSTERLHVLAQSERLGFIADLSIHERLLLIEQQELRCKFLLEQSGVDHLAFGGIAHSMADYVLLLVAKKMGIVVSMHQDLPMIKGAHFIYDGDFAIHSRIKEDSSIRIQKIYEPKTQRTDKWAGTYRFLNQQKSGAQTGIRDHLLGEEEQNKDALEYYKRWQDMSTRLDQVKDVQNSVFIFLHVEPEATVNPILGPSMPRQIDFIRLIRRCVHKSIPIYIKEHPAMFLAAWEDKKVNYNAYRGLPILSEISRLPNCRLLDAEVKTKS